MWTIWHNDSKGSSSRKMKSTSWRRNVDVTWVRHTRLPAAVTRRMCTHDSTSSATRTHNAGGSFMWHPRNVLFGGEEGEPRVRARVGGKRPPIKPNVKPRTRRADRLLCGKHRFASVGGCAFNFKDTVNPGSCSRHRGADFGGVKHCTQAPVLAVFFCFTSSWSPSRTVWDRDPFGEGSWTQELQHYPLGLPWFLQTKPIEHRPLADSVAPESRARGVRLFIASGRNGASPRFCAKPVPWSHALLSSWV